MARRLNVGLVAHVDAGKTTLSEALLYAAGALRRVGRVDHRDAFLDTDTQERERGITIFSKQAELTWHDTQITLVDTPGHVDFSGEAERALRVMDCAVLLISGADGVQGHTLTLWRLLQAYGVPVFLFINKMDQPGTDRTVLMHGIKTRLSDACIDWTDPGRDEEIAACGEEALNAFLETGSIPQQEAARMVAKRLIFPCLFGSALRLKGIEALLDTLCAYMPQPEYGTEFAARVYKISHDPQGARLTWMKITGGTLRTKTVLRIGDADEKINQLRVYSGSRFRLIDEAPAGTLCAATGLEHTQAGDGLGGESAADTPLLTPVFAYRVCLPQGTDPYAAHQKLKVLEEEDPQLHVLWNAALREIRVQLMGEVQLEVLQRLLKDRFGLVVTFDAGGILYRETIEEAVEGVGHYEPLRHYAEVHLLLEPGPRGSGMRFATAVSEDDLDRNWQRLILTHLMEKTHRGVLTGSPLTDMKITLIAGRAHLKHTEGGDFRQATYRAVRQRLMQARSILLEPWYNMRLELPADCVGRAMNDITQMGGGFDAPETLPDCTLLNAWAPVAAAQHYARDVAAYAHGQGRLLCTLRGYAPCREQERVIEEIAYDPERDTENPADSVFCSHGAGYTVSWRDAPAMMHIQTGVMATPAETPAPAPAAPRTAVGDEQLRTIFERTYGPVKTRLEPAPARQTQATVNARPIETKKPQMEYLLVDGYNIIFAWQDLKELSQRSLEQARQALMDILCNYRGVRPCELILVFDAYKVSGGVGAQEDYKGIHLVYTREAETADNYIERTIRSIAPEHRVRVATSDALEQLIILGGGALRMSAQEFRDDVEAAEVEIEEILRQNNAGRRGEAAVGRAMREALDKKG
ncbi:MAG: TetM/TetW/TetO/TetS family tetracycline resistance ribosomal protection protein [Clostridia bacterium]|nr:TetM/TetW/TetO/TetS family tetracycline resistance ribosomal protection protein [Clostridia bacterium]